MHGNEDVESISKKSLLIVVNVGSALSAVEEAAKLRGGMMISFLGAANALSARPMRWFLPG